MKLAKSLKNMLVLTLLGGAVSAQAAVIDFEGYVKTGLNAAPYSEDGYTLTSSIAEAEIFNNKIFEGHVGLDGQMTSVFGWCTSCMGKTVMTLKTTAPFSLYSIDFGPREGGTATVKIVGMLAGGGSIEQSATFTDGNWTRAVFTGFDQLASVQIYTESGADAVMDNLQVSAAVPEPGSLALGGIALLGLAAARRKRPA